MNKNFPTRNDPQARNDAGTGSLSVIVHISREAGQFQKGGAEAVGPKVRKTL